MGGGQPENEQLGDSGLPKNHTSHCGTNSNINKKNSSKNIEVPRDPNIILIGTLMRLWILTDSGKGLIGNLWIPKPSR